MTSLSIDQREELSQTVSPQELTEESPHTPMRVLASLNYRRVEKFISIAKALEERDWKGFGTGYQYQNGVIEIRKEKTMAKWHEPFTWKTIKDVLPMASEEEQDKIYEEIMKRDSWTIALIEELWRQSK